MAQSSDLAADSGGVVSGFFAFTEITEPSAHHDYNEWHQLDHLPEQLPIPGITNGQRWVASPRCKGLTTYASGSSPPGASELSDAHYLTMYLMREPVDETLGLFYDLAVQLHREDRFFPHRRALASGPLDVKGVFASSRVRVSAAAVPYRPNRGIYAVVEPPGSIRSEADMSGIDLASPSELLGIDGVAGVWLFGPGGEAQTHAESRHDGSVPTGAGEVFQADVTICFLDEDPVAVAPKVADVLRPRWEQRGSLPRLAGPFETVVPWSWDWFDEPARPA